MKYRQVTNLLWISMPICVLLRVIQLAFTLDSLTGFVKQQYAQISTLITFVVCAAAVALGILASTADDVEKKERTVKPIVAIACVLTGGMFIYEMVASVAVLEVGSIRALLLVILGIASAIAFIAYGVQNIYDYKFPSILLIIPVIYYIVKLINLFVNTSALALVTKNIFMLFTNAALLLFVFELASFENGINNSIKKAKTIFAVGVVTITLCVVTALPQIINAIVLNEEMLNGDIATALLMLTQAIFVFAYLNANFYQKQSKTPKPESKHSA